VKHAVYVKILMPLYISTENVHFTNKHVLQINICIVVALTLTNIYMRRIYNYTLNAMRFTLVKRNTKSDRLKAAGVLNPQAERVLAPEFQVDTFFDPRDLVQVKYEMLRMVSQDGASKSDAAERFGMSRPTLYQAQAAYERDGLVGLLPRQRGPKGAHKLDSRIMEFIDAHLEEGDPIQAPRLALLVEAEFGLQVHPRSIERAVQRKKKRQQK
jgi:transposase